MNMQKIWEAAIKVFIKAIILFTIAAIVFGCIDSCNEKTSKTTSPVKKMEVVDSLKLDNNKLVLELGTIDSIKNVKVVEVKNLDNDSTLKLFYELIRE